MAKKSTRNGNGSTRNEQIEEMRLAQMGDDLFDRFSFGIPDLESLRGSNPVAQDAEQMPNYSKAVIAKLVSAYTDHKVVIGELKKRASDWREAARLSFALASDQFFDWAERLVPEIGVEFTSQNDSLKLGSAKLAIRGTAAAWIENLTKLSNHQIRGKKAEEGKASKPGMMDDPKRGKRLNNFQVSNTELVKGKATVSFYVEDADGVLRAFILEVCEVADLFDRGDRKAAAQIFERLTDATLDARFGFDRELVAAFVQGRIYGKLASAAQQQVKEAEEKQAAYLRSVVVEAADEERLADLRRAIERQKEKQAEESAPNPSNANVQTVQPMQGITPKSKAMRIVARLARRLDITDHVKVEEVVDTLIGDETLTEANVLTIFSDLAVNEYLTIVRDDLIKSGFLIKQPVTELATA